MSIKAKPIQAGVIGAGLMGYWHAKAIGRAGGRLSAVVDPDLMSARRLAAGYHGAESFSELSQVLDRIRLDVLHICTPPFAHYKIAQLAIEAGLNVMIEKPMTVTAQETEYLLDRASDRGVLICPVHQFIFLDGLLKAKELLPRIGRVVHMEGTFRSAGGAGLPFEQLDEIAADILPHPLSLMQVFLPTGLPKVNWLTVHPGYGEFLAVGEASGASLSVFISMSARPTACSFQIVGTAGTIHIDLFHGFSFIETGEVSRTRKLMRPFDTAVRRLSAATFNIGRRVIRREPAYPGLQRLVGSFYQAIRTGAEPPISPEDTLAVARVRDLLVRDSGLAGHEPGPMGS